MNNFVKTLNNNGAEFKYLESMCPRISERKLKGGIFVDPQIRELTRDKHFEEGLADVEVNAWFSFKNIVPNYLRNSRSPGYEKRTQDLISSFQNLRSRMSVKIYFLHSLSRTVGTTVRKKESGSFRTFAP